MPFNNYNTEVFLVDVLNEFKFAARLAITIAGPIMTLSVGAIGAWVIGASLMEPLCRYLSGDAGAARDNIVRSGWTFLLIVCPFVGLHLFLLHTDGIGQSHSRFPSLSTKDLLDGLQPLGLLSGVTVLLMTGLTWSALYELRTPSVILLMMLAYAGLYDPLVIRFGNEENPLAALSGWVIYALSGGLVLLWILSRGALLVVKALSWFGLYRTPTDTGVGLATEKQTKVGSEANTEPTKSDPER